MSQQILWTVLAFGVLCSTSVSSQGMDLPEGADDCSHGMGDDYCHLVFGTGYSCFVVGDGAKCLSAIEGSSSGYESYGQSDADPNCSGERGANYCYESFGYTYNCYNKDGNPTCLNVLSASSYPVYQHIHEAEPEDDCSGDKGTSYCMAKYGYDHSCYKMPETEQELCQPDAAGFGSPQI